MEKRKLGRTGIEVSVVAMGCWSIAGGKYWGDQEEKTSIEAIHAALDAGITLFDTAEGYGNGYSEELLGKGLGKNRSRVAVATKLSSGHLRPADIRPACEGSLRRLGTDYIDLYQVHWPRHDVPFEETFGILEALRDEGKIRAIGVSNFGAGDLHDALLLARIEADQLPYSLLWRAIEHEVVESCTKDGLSILAYSPLAQGLLAGKYGSPEEVPAGRRRTKFFGEDGNDQEAMRVVFEALEEISGICSDAGLSMISASLAWLLRRPGVTSVLAGARTAEQMRESVAAAEIELTDEVAGRLDAATEKAKRHFGADPDPWRVESRYR